MKFQKSVISELETVVVCELGMEGGHKDLTQQFSSSMCITVSNRVNILYIIIYISLSLSLSPYFSLCMNISHIRALSHLRYLSHSILRNVIKHAGSSHTSTVRPHSNFLDTAGLALCGIPFCSSKDRMTKM